MIFLVPTPIGHLADMTFRAVQTLREVDWIAAEDTRQTVKLLRHYQIENRMVPLHQHNEHHKIPALLDNLKASGQRMAYVTDAGMPGISDPGFLIVREALARQIPVQALPGPTAVIPALVASGLPCDRFVFEGFLPVQKGRKTRILALQSEARTIVLYESPHRIRQTLQGLAEVLGPERQACIARELSKLHEEFLRGTLAELISHYEIHTPKGEYVLVVAGCP
jgi:16S rRNA (cytidine1402-2'-O)-methyltransferase